MIDVGAIVKVPAVCRIAQRNSSGLVTRALQSPSDVARDNSHPFVPGWVHPFPDDDNRRRAGHRTAPVIGMIHLLATSSKELGPAKCVFSRANRPDTERSSPWSSDR